MESAEPVADAAQQTTQIRRTGANHLTLQFPPPHDQPSTIPRLNSLEAGCVAEGKTSQSARPWVAPGNRTPDAHAPATNHSHRLRDLVGDKFLRSATLFRNRGLRSTDSYGTFRLQKFDSLGATSSGPGRPRNALPSPRLDPTRHVPSHW